MSLKIQAVCLSVGLFVAAGCGKSDESTTPQGQVEALAVQENRCPIVTETRTTAEANLLVANSVKARVTRPETQNFIRQTIKGHYADIVRISQIVSKNTMSPIDSKQAQGLREAAPSAAAILKDQSGVGLDLAYLDWQIQAYAQTLDLMENRWLKMATTPDLVTFLHQFQAVITERLATARALRESLN